MKCEPQNGLGWNQKISALRKPVTLNSRGKIRATRLQVNEVTRLSPACRVSGTRSPGRQYKQASAGNTHTAMWCVLRKHPLLSINSKADKYLQDRLSTGLGILSICHHSCHSGQTTLQKQKLGILRNQKMLQHDSSTLALSFIRSIQELKYCFILTYCLLQNTKSFSNIFSLTSNYILPYKIVQNKHSL